MDELTSKKIPLVSVGMPVFNGEKYIREALDSLLVQTFTDFELIISDNASTDNTEAICKEYVNKDARIRYVRQPENRGGAANFRFVLDEADGEYFMFMAHDDIRELTWIEKAVDFLVLNPSTILCASDVMVMDEDVKVFRTEKLTRIYPHNAWQDSRKYFFEIPTSNIFFSIYGMYRTEILRTHYYDNKGIWWKGIVTNSEVPFLARLALVGRIVALPEVLQSYRLHKDSTFKREFRTLNILDFIILRFTIIIMLLRIIFSKSRDNIFEKASLVFTVLRSASLGAIMKFVFRLVRYSLRKLENLHQP